MRSISRVVPALLMLSALSAPVWPVGGPPLSGVAWAAPPGTLYIVEGHVEATGPDFDKALKAASRTSLTKNDSDVWHVSFVAFLKKQPGAEEVHLVFYEAGVKEPVNAYPIRTRATAKILAAEVDIKPEDGFKPGHKYQVLITRLINGREEVYARTGLELK